jgi:hypothetical protein
MLVHSAAVPRHPRPRVSSPERPSMRTLLLRSFRPSTFAIGVLAVLFITAALYPLSGRLRFAAEATVYLLLVLGCASWAPLRRVVGQLGWARLAVLGVAFTVAAAAQLTKSYGPHYPFVRWTMYSSVNPTAAYARYDALLASGRTIPLPLADIVPGASVRAFLSHFNRELRQLEAVPEVPEEAGGKLPGLTRMLIEVADVYNQRHPADPIREVHVTGCLIPLRGYQGLESMECNRLLSLNLAPESRP